MATTKLYLDTRGSAGENGSVKVVISHNRKSAYMNLGLKAPIAKWDAQHLCVSGGENDTVSLSVPSLRHTQRNSILLPHRGAWHPRASCSCRFSPIPMRQ